jgi:hypothetical protein
MTLSVVAAVGLGIAMLGGVGKIVLGWKTMQVVPHKRKPWEIG